MTVASGAAFVTSAGVRVTRRVERMRGQLVKPSVPVTSSPVFAPPRRSAPLSERPPPCHLERRPAAHDPDCRCSLMFLVFAATTSMLRPWPSAARRAPGRRHSIVRACPDPTTPRTGSPTALRQHEPMLKSGPDVRATPANAWPEPPPRSDRSRHLESPEGRRARANRPQARVAEVGRASHRSSRPPAWDAVRESPSHHRRPSVRTAANALPYCLGLVRPTISPSAASGAHRCSSARAVSIAPSLRRCKALLARARSVKAPIDGCKAVLDGCPHERSPDAWCASTPAYRATRRAARSRPTAAAPRRWHPVRRSRRARAFASPWPSSEHWRNPPTRPCGDSRQVVATRAGTAPLCERPRRFAVDADLFKPPRPS